MEVNERMAVTPGADRSARRRLLRLVVSRQLRSGGRVHLIHARTGEAGQKRADRPRRSLRDSCIDVPVDRGRHRR